MHIHPNFIHIFLLHWNIQVAIKKLQPTNKQNCYLSYLTLPWNKFWRITFKVQNECKWIHPFNIDNKVLKIVASKSFSTSLDLPTCMILQIPHTKNSTKHHVTMEKLLCLGKMVLFHQHLVQMCWLFIALHATIKSLA